MNKEVILIGAGGHSKVIADIIIKSKDNILGFIDDNRNDSEIPFNYPKLGKLNDIYDVCEKFPNAMFIIAIGENNTRKRISEKFNINYYTAIHPNSTIGLDVKIGEGTCVMSNAVINSATKVGKHCIINTGAIVEHDNYISDYVHVSPNVSIGGSVKVGELTHLGIGCTLINGLFISSDIKVGAGAVVVSDILQKGIYLGIPARKVIK